jgi:hypothetical protein
VAVSVAVGVNVGSGVGVGSCASAPHEIKNVKEAASKNSSLAGAARIMTPQCTTLFVKHMPFLTQSQVFLTQNYR